MYDFATNNVCAVRNVALISTILLNAKNFHSQNWTRNFPRTCVGALLTHRYATTVGEQKPFSLEFEIISARPATLLSISISARTGMTIIAIRVRP